MKTNLLNDIIMEGSYAEFREELHICFKTEVHRHRTRRTLAWLTLAASIALFASASLFFHRNQKLSIANSRLKQVPTIRTARLDPDRILVTTARPLELLETKPTPVSFTSKAHPEVQLIDDRQLLSLFPDHPTGLVAAGGTKQLIFIDPADAKKFMSSN